MTYKTILVHVDDSPDAAVRITLAARLALRHDAHLVGIALTGVSRLFYQEGSAALVRSALAPYMDDLYRRSERRLAGFTRLAEEAGVASHEARLVDDEAGAGLALSARYADLVVLGQQARATAAPPGGALAPYLVLACPRPVLLLPHARPEPGPRFGARVVVAWNGSAEAMRAASAALPLLREADSVTLASFGAPGAPDAEPALAGWLERHGIAAGFVRESAHLDVGARLLALLAEREAGLLVMGGYGHTRLSELVLGGVTRTVLAGMRIPVLLAH